jgi:hypothetical protein
MAGTVLAAFLGILGFCLLIGWAQAFAQRLYLLFVALCLMALAAAAVLPAGSGRTAALAAAGVLLVVAFAFAARETLRSMRQIREQRQALEQQMWAYLEELKKKQGRTGEEP